MPDRPTTVALTFEGGGDPSPLPAILDTLARSRARATFFIDGRWAEANPELVRAIGRGGHELANHGYRHVDWTTMSDGEIEADAAATEALAESLAGSTTKPWARPPYGALDERVIAVLARLGYSALYRDAVDGAHWPGETTPETVARRAMQAARDESVVVFHTNSPETAEALPAVLSELERRGWRPVVLSELERALPPRTERHPDFLELAIAPGAVRPSRAGGRWQSLNLLELGAARARPPGLAEEVARLDGASLELVTGGDEELEWRHDPADRYMLVLAGSLRCELRDESGELGVIVARSGDFFLCPGGVEVRLGPEHGRPRRFIAVVWRRASP